MSAELQPRKKLKKQVDLWLGTVERINGEIENLEQRVAQSSTISRGFHTVTVLKKIQEVEDLLQQGKFDQGLVVDDLTQIGQALTTTTLVGQAAEICKKEIWTCLMDDDVRKIGVWGMGGIGKTTIMKIINNQLLEETQKFNIVIWVTVSKEMNISKIQKGILRAIGEDLYEDEEEAIRAGKLYKRLIEKGRYVLILDDLWDKLSLEEVGIPEPCNGSKLVITTRKLDVCRYLDCREVKMRTLLKHDAWSFFLEKVGRDILNYPNLLPIVESVVEQCAGLSLAIVTVASSMKGIRSIHEWRNALNELSRPVKSVTGLDEKVFQQLQFSYDHLENEKVQHCFLCCALHPEDSNISEFALIRLWIAEGLVEEMDSQQAEFDQGRTILNKLKNNCLLENGTQACEFTEDYEDLAALKKHYEEVGVEAVREEERNITKYQFHEAATNGKFDQGVAVDDLMWIGQALSTTNLVGKAAENCMEEIWTCLMDDDIEKIGVWGMGGVDDLWDKLSLEEVGIPQPSNGSKLVVTTRMLDVCRYLGCREIRMPTLPKQDAWSLFLEKVGRDVLNYPDLLPIVESVVEQCAGLPLAIVTVASSMKGITNVHEWRNALNELSRCVRGVTGLDEKVLQQLQFSYDHLNDERVQHCFLCCALYPEDHNISEFNLIKLWIAEGLVEEMDSQRAEFDQ
ncbi:NB-ARC - like 10, partial [Theobroma cacao]